MYEMLGGEWIILWQLASSRSNVDQGFGAESIPVRVPRDIDDHYYWNDRIRDSKIRGPTVHNHAETKLDLLLTLPSLYGPSVEASTYNRSSVKATAVSRSPRTWAR